MVGEHGRRLEHKGSRPINKRSVDDVRVPRDPAHVRHASEDIPLFEPEGVLRGHAGVQEVPSCGVRHALRGAC